MPQIFPPWANKVPLYLVAVLGAAGLIVPAFIWYYFSPDYTDVGYRPEQPVPFSHLLHAGELEMDCRYCHAQVEVAAVASVPPTKVCMNCHSLVGQTSELLEPIRESMADNDPMRWIRVHELPEYSYFDHGVHVRAGVGCQSCHGDIRSMEVVTQMEPLSMSWCLECHRNPDAHLRTPDQITNTSWRPPRDQLEFAASFKEAREAENRPLEPPVEDCTGCHR